MRYETSSFQRIGVCDGGGPRDAIKNSQGREICEEP